MFLKFSEEAQKLLLLSLKEKKKLNDSFIGTEHVFLSALSMSNSYIGNILNDCDIFYDRFFSLLKKKDSCDNDNYYVFTPLMKSIFNNLSNGKKKGEVTSCDIIFEIISSNNSKAMIVLKKMGIDIKKLLKYLNNDLKKKKNLKKGILNEIGVNLNEKCIGDNDIVLERDEEINMIMEILCCRNKNNPILLGDAGVGKTAVVEELARRIVNGDVPLKLRDKKIYSVSMSSLVAGTKYRGEFEEKINKLILEVESSEDIILFIDEIHTLVGAGGADGAIDASNILKPSLARGNIKIIGATTLEEYKKYFGKDKALSRRFQIVNICEPDLTKTKKILYGIKSIYEDYHNVAITTEIIDMIIYYANKYIPFRKFPDKAIDILDEVCVLSSISLNKSYNSTIYLDKKLNELVKLKNKALLNNDYKSAIEYSHTEKKLFSKLSKSNYSLLKNNKKIVVDEKVLFKVMERKTNIPFYSYRYENKKIIDKFKTYKKNSIFCLELINKICHYTLNIYSNIVNNGFSNSLWISSDSYNLNNYFINEYISTFFNKCNLVMIDMNNYKSVDNLIKNNDYYNKEESFIDKIKINPYSIVVIDNYDNSDFSIKEFFEKIMRTGYYLDRNNEKIDFSNVLFIYSILDKNKSIGFNKLKGFNVKEDNMFNINSISEVKLKNKIKDICITNKYSINNSVIGSVKDSILNNNDNLCNIDYLIRKEFFNNKVNINKSRTMQV